MPEKIEKRTRKLLQKGSIDQCGYMDDERIIAYLKGELSQTERLAFEEQLSQDQALAEAVHFWSLMLAADSAEGRELTKAAALIKDAVKQEMPRLAEDGKRKSYTGWWWIVGALVLALLVAGAYYYLRGSNTEPAKSEVLQPSPSSLGEEPPIELDTAAKEADRSQPEASTRPGPASDSSPSVGQKPDDDKADVSAIVASKFAPLQRLGTTMGGRSGSDTLGVILEAAFEAYQESNPKKTIALLRPKVFDNKVAALKLRANAYFQLGDYQSAMHVLDRLRQSAIRGIKEQAEWNLLICSILADKAWPASLEEKLSDEDHPYRDSLYRLLPYLKQ